MMTNPRPGQLVQCWYAKRYCDNMPLHGMFGIVRIVGQGKPRNHGVEVKGELYCVPCGNLRKARP